MTIFNIDELNKEWELFKNAREHELNPSLPKYLFEGSLSTLNDNNFETVINEGEEGFKSALMTKKCEKHDGQLAVILSDYLRENQVAIVQNKDIAKKLYSYRDFKPMGIGDKLLTAFMTGLAGLSIVGISILYLCENFYNLSEDLTTQYTLMGTGIGGLSFALLGYGLANRYSKFKNRRYNEFQNNLPFRPYKGIDAIDVILSAHGDYESKFTVPQLQK
jgi:hypothetical protein